MGKKEKTKKTGWVYSRNLVRKQQIMQKALGRELGVVVLTVFVTVYMLIVAMPDFRVEPVEEILLDLGVYGLLLGCVMVFLIGAIRRYRILRQLYGIASPAGQEIQMKCKKVKFMTMAVSKHTAVLICTVFHSEGGNKYYHVHNDRPLWHGRMETQYRQYQGQECTLICYKDTAIIKEIPEP